MLEKYLAIQFSTKSVKLVVHIRTITAHGCRCSESQREERGWFVGQGNDEPGTGVLYREAFKTQFVALPAGHTELSADFGSVSSQVKMSIDQTGTRLTQSCMMPASALATNLK